MMGKTKDLIGENSKAAKREAELVRQVDKLFAENAKLKAELDHLRRKVDHGCTDAICSICDSKKG